MPVLQPHVDLVADDDVGVNAGRSQSTLVSQEQSDGDVAGEEVLDQHGSTEILAGDSIVVVARDEVPANLRPGVHEGNAVEVVGDVVPADIGTGFDQDDARPWTVSDAVLDDQSVMRVDSTQGDVAVDVVRDDILLDDGVGVLDDQDALAMVLVDFVLEDEWEGFLGDFDSRFLVEPDEVVLHHFGLVVLALDQDAVLPVARDADVLLDGRLAQHLLVSFADYPVLLLPVDLVQVDRRERTVDLDAGSIVTDVVPTDLHLAPDAHFDTHSVGLDLVQTHLHRVFLTDCMDAHRIAMDLVLDES